MLPPSTAPPTPFFGGNFCKMSDLVYYNLGGNERSAILNFCDVVFFHFMTSVAPLDFSKTNLLPLEIDITKNIVKYSRDSKAISITAILLVLQNQTPSYQQKHFRFQGVKTH